MRTIQLEKHLGKDMEEVVCDSIISHNLRCHRNTYKPCGTYFHRAERSWMLYTFTIKGTLPGLNEYLKAERSFHNRHSTGNDMKQQYQMIISNAIRLNLKRTHINNPVRIKYTFYEPNRKRDLDNIAGVAHKFIQDALVKCKVLDNDGWNNIVGFEDHFFIDKHNPRIEVVLEEVKP